ncbi:MAG TPA: YncE family protein [Burkholderiaceae bacterium]
MAACTPWAASATPGTLPLKTVADLPLPGNTTRWDYASIDVRRGLLYLAHLGDGKVIVVDTTIDRVVAEIPNVGGVHGVLAIPELGRVYASATGTDEVVAIDTQTFKIVARIPAGNYPDGLAYAAARQKIYVSDEHGGTDTVIDVRTNRRVATIPIGREVGNTQFDPVSGHVFVNEQTSNELVEIDPATDKVVGRTPLPGAEGAHGLYIDAPARTAYVACEDNARLLVVDLKSKRVISAYEVGSAPDVIAFDESLGWLYVAGEAGVVSVFNRHDGTLTPLGEGQLGPNAHVVAVDASTHRAYFPLRNIAGKSVLRITAPSPQP